MEELEFIKQQVYYAARDGMPVTLHHLLSDKSPEEIHWLINEATEDGEQKCTPIVIAAKNGHTKVVRFLLKFNSGLEHEGIVMFDGSIIDGAAALWCAAGAGHLSVVKLLVRSGADVNHATGTNSTPLRAACFNGRLDIVKYLHCHKADLNIPNKYNNTCLMIAAYRGHVDAVSYLLEHGANPDAKAHCGATPLHFSSECGHVAIVQELLKHGAHLVANDYGMTPLLCAAERTKYQIVEYFSTLKLCSRQERIDAYELLGATFANDKDNYSVSRAMEYLYEGMGERYNGEEVIHKPEVETIAAYEHHKESRNMEELQALHNNTNALHMEGLAIRERILGSHNPELTHSIIFRGAVFADCARFDRCLQLWLHALSLKIRNFQSVNKDLLRFAQVFSQMIHVGVQLPLDLLLEVLIAGVTELERLRNILSNAAFLDNYQMYLEELGSNISTVLYLLVIVGKLRGWEGQGSPYQEVPPEWDLEIHKLVYRLVQLQLRDTTGRTMLHLASSPDTPVDDFHTSDVCSFPCAATVRLLIKCGSDVNAMDANRNTPLHLVVLYNKPISDFMTLHSIIEQLIQAGAHLDTVNSKNETPYNSATTGVAELILKTHTQIMSLKCLAARAVNLYNVSYDGNVPTTLETFIQLHGPGS